MPVTIFPAPHGSEPCEIGDLLRNAESETVLKSCAAVKLKAGQTDPTQKLRRIFKSSFEQEEHIDVYASGNGFVHSAVRAYNAHHHLRIRPDDIWIAILTQLSIYVNANAEALRSVFVSHQGQKQLKLEGAVLEGFENFANKITEVFSKEVKDSTMPPWIMQEFSTTTATDRIAAGIIMMATFQKYFTYFDGAVCGLPSVTLLGERSDWIQLLGAIDRLSTFVPETADASEGGPTAQMNRWVSLLRPILKRFVTSFDQPNTTETLDFWQRIADYRVGGSGADMMSGWLTAFCFWKEDGECIARFDVPSARHMLTLDDADYPHLDWEDIPPGWATVPLELFISPAEVYQCRMLAGSVGITPFLAQTEGDPGSKLPPQAEMSAAAKSKSNTELSFTQRVLTCCEPDREPADVEPARVHVGSKAVVTEKAKLKSSPFPAQGEIINLPPYPGRPEVEPPQPFPYFEGKHPIRDHERLRWKAPEGEAPPAYKLDGLQPRIGWWLWQEREEIEVNTQQPSKKAVVDGMDYIRQSVNA